MANRMGASPLMVMQNLYVVHGTPGWSAKFLIACFNQCGKFSALRYEFDTRDGKQVACRAWAIEKSTGERLVGATVSLEMAKAEGWSEKSGSKWRTMAEQMMMYRAAAFMIRTYAPEISMGLRTVDEIADNVIDLDEATVGDLRSAPAGGAGAPSSDPAPVGGVVATPAENAPGAHSDGSGEQGPADPFVEDLNRAERADNQRRRK